MTVETTKKEMLQALRNSRRVLLTGHVGADGDSVGSILAVARWLEIEGIPFVIANEGVIPEIYQFLPGLYHFKRTEDIPFDQRDFDCALVMEASNLKRIGRVRDLIKDECCIINIDHHPDNNNFGQLNWVDAGASSAGEMIFGLFRMGEINITKDMATNLYTAIMTDTGRFHFSNTTPAALHAVAELVELGADPPTITDQVYFQQPANKILLTGLALSSMEILSHGSLCTLTISREMLEKTQSDKGNTEGIINKTMAVDGVQVGVLFTELEPNLTKVSFRSRCDVDVSQVAANFNGGGHKQASGANLPLPLAQARKTVIDYLKDKLNGSV